MQAGGLSFPEFHASGPKPEAAPVNMQRPRNAIIRVGPTSVNTEGDIACMHTTVTPHNANTPDGKISSTTLPINHCVHLQNRSETALECLLRKKQNSLDNARGWSLMARTSLSTRCNINACACVRAALNNASIKCPLTSAGGEVCCLPPRRMPSAHGHRKEKLWEVLRLNERMATDGFGVMASSPTTFQL